MYWLVRSYLEKAGTRHIGLFYLTEKEAITPCIGLVYLTAKQAGRPCIGLFYLTAKQAVHHVLAC
jgi:hypothetical protein